MDRAGDGKDFAVLLQCHSCGNQGTAFFSRFDHQQALAKPADDPVAPGEMVGFCQVVPGGNSLKPSRPVLTISCRQINMPCWIHSIQPSPGHGNGIAHWLVVRLGGWRHLSLSAKPLVITKPQWLKVLAKAVWRFLSLIWMGCGFRR